MEQILYNANSGKFTIGCSTLSGLVSKVSAEKTESGFGIYLNPEKSKLPWDKPYDHKKDNPRKKHDGTVPPGYEEPEKKEERIIDVPPWQIPPIDQPPADRPHISRF